jgi:hypothetical protein
MLYCDIYKNLKNAFDIIDTEVEPDDLSIRIRKKVFQSPGFGEEYTYPQDSLNENDNDLKSNISFNYYIVENTGNSIPSGIMFLFHGLNEKRWDKYLPWAYHLTKSTGKTVILFPIAFHMNRAPAEWSNSRLMQKLAVERACKSTNSHSSFVNAAISERLDSYPQRFFLSGLQTYVDFFKLVKLIRDGHIYNIPANVEIDLFGYSVGAFFSLMMMMDNPGNILTNARLFMFCGGATYDKTYPVSKYIVDKNASTSVSFFFNELFKDKLRTEKVINRNFEKFVQQQNYFAAMMNYKQFKDLRGKRLAQIYERIKVITLKRDDVITPLDVEDSLSTISDTNKTDIDTMDFDFPYSHVVPFPLLDKYNLQVDRSFKCVMDKASGFLS